MIHWTGAEGGLGSFNEPELWIDDQLIGWVHRRDEEWTIWLDTHSTELYVYYHTLEEAMTDFESAYA